MSSASKTNPSSKAREPLTRARYRNLSFAAEGGSTSTVPEYGAPLESAAELRFIQTHRLRRLR